MCKLLVAFAAAAINYTSVSLWSLSKEFSPFRELEVLDMYDTISDHNIRLNTSSKRKQEPYKTFKILT